MAHADSTQRVSARVFENPAARSFMEALEKSRDLGLVNHTMGRVVGLSEDVGLAECQAAVAAAAVVAALLHPQAVELPAPLARHFAGAPHPHRELVGVAVEALERVRDGEELAQELSGEALTECRGQVEALLACLEPDVEAPLMEQEGAPAGP